jgi:CheY-like chemotaxis protein
MTTDRKRILVLASDEHFLIELDRLLEDEGLETTTTWDTGEALRLSQDRPFDLLLVGDHPPEIRASEVLRETQCGPGNTPCVVVLAAAGPFSEQYFYALGASAVIVDWRCEGIVRRVRERFFADRSAAAV